MSWIQSGLKQAWTVINSEICLGKRSDGPYIDIKGYRFKMSAGDAVKLSVGSSFLIESLATGCSLSDTENT